MRDRVLERASEIVAGCQSRAEAEAALRVSLDKVEAAAAEAISAAGSDCRVKVELGEEEYPTKAMRASVFRPADICRCGFQSGSPKVKTGGVCSSPTSASRPQPKKG